jgi:hypothetical protein
MFEHMFSMPQPSVSNAADADGTEERPIHIPNAAEPEFDLFVSQSYGMYVYALPACVASDSPSP